MKKIGELMKEAGFNPNAKDSVKEAFIKHLIKASTGQNVATPTEQKLVAENPQTILPLKTAHQLSFDFEETVLLSPKARKKASTF